jgi:L-malate glycosyltransferase
LIMTNDVSNLGNPVLEAIFYKTPIISINDGSLDNFLTNDKDSVLINLDENFDLSLAKAISKLASDLKYYNKLKLNLARNRSVHSLNQQQKNEIKAIIDTIKHND